MFDVSQIDKTYIKCRYCGFLMPAMKVTIENAISVIKKCPNCRSFNKYDGLWNIKEWEVKNEDDK